MNFFWRAAVLLLTTLAGADRSHFIFTNGQQHTTSPFYGAAHNREGTPLPSLHTPYQEGPFAGYSYAAVNHFDQSVMAYHLLQYVGADVECNDTIESAFERLSSAQQAQLLTMHGYYRIAHFLACIRLLPDYEKHIKKLHALHNKSTWFGKGWNKFIGKVPPTIDALHSALPGDPPTSPVVQSLLTDTSSDASYCSYAVDEVETFLNYHHEYWYDDEHSADPYYSARSTALERARTQQHAAAKKSFTLSGESQNFMRAYMLDDDLFTQCTGDAYQQHLHQEFITAVDQAALLYHDHHATPLLRDVTQSVGEYAALGVAYNHAERVIEATKTANLCHYLVEFAQALADGVYDGACSALRDEWHSLAAASVTVLNACSHPIDTAAKVSAIASTIPTRIGHAASYGQQLIERVAEHFCDVACDLDEITLTCISDSVVGYHIMRDGCYAIREDVQTAINRIQELAHAFPSVLVAEHVRLGAAFITEHGLKLASSHLCGKVYGRVASHALNYAATVAQKTGATVTTGGKACFDLAQTISNNLAHGIAETGAALGKSKYLNVTRKVFAVKKDEITALAVWAKKLAQPVVDSITATGIKTIHVTEEFLHHIFSAEIKEYTKRSGEIKKKLSGFHHFTTDYLQKHGITLTNSKVCAKTGVIIADVVCDGHTEEKTFFPPSWDRKKAIKKIREATKNITKLFQKGDRLIVLGKTSEGIIIQVVIDQEGNLLTAFPDAIANNLCR